MIFLRVNDTTFVKGQYLFELDQKDKLTNRISINLGLMTFIFTGLLFYVDSHSVPKGNITLINIAIGVVLLLLTISLIKSCYYLFKAFMGYDYIILPGLEELKNKEGEVVKHYEEHYDSYYREHHNGKSMESLISKEMDRREFSLYWRGSVRKRELNLIRIEYTGLLTRQVLKTFLIAMLLIILPVLPIVWELIFGMINTINEILQ